MKVAQNPSEEDKSIVSLRIHPYYRYNPQPIMSAVDTEDPPADVEMDDAVSEKSQIMTTDFLEFLGYVQNSVPLH